MTTKQQIRSEIGRLEKMDYPVDTYEQSLGFYNALDRIKAFLDTLPDEPVSDDLEKAAEAKYPKQYAYMPKGGSTIDLSQILRSAFIAGAEWVKAKMMKGTVEGEVCGRCYGHLNIRFVGGVYKGLEPKNISHIPADVSKYNIGDKVKVIIVKEE